MPSHWPRPSTRVFVLKAVTKAAAAAATRPLNENGEAKKAGVVEASASPPPASTPVVEEEPHSASPKDEMLGIVYRRKRRRPHADVSPEGKRHGIGYLLRQTLKKPKVESLSKETRSGKLVLADSARSFACKAAGILEEDLCGSRGGPMAIALLVESSSIAGSCWFSCVLLSILYWMGRPGVELRGFAAILFSESLARFFSRHGVHFLPVKQLEFTALSRNAESGCGICVLYCAGSIVPLLTINFSAAPLCFKRFHEAVVFASIYLPAALATHLEDLVRQNSLGSARSGFSATEVSNFVTVPAELNELQLPAEASELVSKNMDSLSIPWLNHPRKKRSKTKPWLDHPWEKRSYLTTKPRKGIAEASGPVPGNMVSLSIPRHPPPLQNRLKKQVRIRISPGSFPRRRIASTEPSPVKPPNAHPRKVVTVREDSVPSPCGPPKTNKIPTDKNLKRTLSWVKKKIDETTCHADILVTGPDQSWTEEDAEISLEVSESRQWCIQVKVQNVKRHFIELPDLKSQTTNSDDHAYTYAIDDHWTLKFKTRWEWLVFQELVTECRSRMSKKLASLKPILVPGVQEVSGYDEVTTSSFRRPDLYIRSVDGDVKHALASDTPLYDMDSGDEKWLKQLNSTSFDSEHGDLGHIPENDFEKVIFTLEKNAYNNPLLDSEDGDLGHISKENALDLCQNLGKRDLLAAVFDYWLEKRTKKGGVLVRVFEVKKKDKSPLRRKSTRKKKQSQGGRGNQGTPLHNDAENVQEVDLFANEAARRKEIASQALQKAIELRSRAQKFTAHADLASYKSVMALRIAEAKEATSNSQNFVSSILD